MEYFSTSMAAIALAISALTLAGTLELALLTVGGLLAPRKPGARRDDLAPRHLAVVVPAHNEENMIGRCITSLMNCDKPNCRTSIYVVADNCTDGTERLAREAGAQVLVRRDEARRGKGYALDHAFQLLLARDIDVMLVIDADTEVEKNFLTACEQAFASGAAAIQCRYTVNNPDIATRTRIMHIAMLAHTVLRPRGRAFWGLSAGIFGNGFGLTRRALQLVPYQAHSVVEDIEYHLALVIAGIKVEFVDSTGVRADMPTGGRGVDSQRARWEGGRLRMAREKLPVLTRAVLTGKWRLLEPLLELLLLPLALHVSLLLLILLIPYVPTQVYAGIGLGAVLVHVLAALFVGGGSLMDFATLARVPFYVGWKLLHLPEVFRTARRDAAWVRTEREYPAVDSAKKMAVSRTKDDQT